MTKLKEFIRGHLTGFAIVMLFAWLFYITAMYVLRSNHLI